MPTVSIRRASCLRNSHREVMPCPARTCDKVLKYGQMIANVYRYLDTVDAISVSPVHDSGLRTISPRYSLSAVEPRDDHPKLWREDNASCNEKISNQGIIHFRCMSPTAPTRA